MTKDEFAKQTEQLARQLRDAIDHWDDPDRVAAREAYETEKAARQAAIAELTYIKTGQHEPSDLLETAIGKMVRYFSDRIEDELPSTGGFEAIRQPLPNLPGRIRVFLEITSLGSGRQLELRLEGPARPPPVRRAVLLRGTNRQVVGLLRAESTAEFLIAWTQRLKAAIADPQESLGGELRGLLGLVTEARLPSASDLEAYFRGRKLSIRTAGPSLDHPQWASTVRGAGDVFVEVGSNAVLGIHVWGDPRGFAVAELAIGTGSLAEVVAVTGPLEPSPRSTQSSFARSTLRGRRIPVYIEHENDAVRLVSVHFDPSSGGT